MQELSLGFFQGLELENVLKVFRNQCVHCRRIPGLVSRPYHLTDVAKKPRQILHSDYLYMGQLEGYILVFYDNYSCKVLLKYSPNVNSFNMAQGLLEWRAKFELNDEFLVVTDNASHFCNKLLRQVSKALRFTHKWSVAYSPWRNGQMEVVNSSIITHVQQLSSDYDMPEGEWMLLLPNVEYLINVRPSPHRKNFTPNQLFLGHSESQNKWLVGQITKETLDELGIITAKGKWKLIRPECSQLFRICKGNSSFN